MRQANVGLRAKRAVTNGVDRTRPASGVFKLAASRAVTARASLAMAWTLRNSSTTPSAIGSSDPTIVCVRGYSRSVRPPYSYTWRKFRVSVFRAYGIPHEQWRGYTLDHLEVRASLADPTVLPKDLIDVASETARAASARSEASTEVSTQSTFGTNVIDDQRPNDQGTGVRGETCPESPMAYIKRRIREITSAPYPRPP
jgi:hypothetical protein